MVKQEEGRVLQEELEGDVAEEAEVDEQAQVHLRLLVKEQL
jgi:hypothetical protein